MNYVITSNYVKMNAEAGNNLIDLALQKIEFGNNLIQQLNDYSKLEGVKKLQKKINQELTFLKKVLIACSSNLI